MKHVFNRYHEQAEKTAAGFVERLQEMALAMPQMCCALYLQALAHPRQVTCQPVFCFFSFFCFFCLLSFVSPVVFFSHKDSIVMTIGIQSGVNTCAFS